jgi:O-antigen/teichoic acid export membrane protein
MAASTEERLGRRSPARNVLSLLTSQGITFTLATVVTIVLPRVLGPEGMGNLRLGVSLWTIAGVCISFGTPFLLTKEFARDPNAGSRLVKPTLLLQAGLFVAAGVALLAWATGAGYSQRAVEVIVVLGLYTLAFEWGNTARAALLGLERGDFIARADVIGKVVFVLLILALVLIGIDERGAAGAMVVHASVTAGLLFYALTRFPVIAQRPPAARLRPLARASRPYFAVAGVVVVYQQIDVVVISLVAGEQTVGWYAAADALLGAMLFVPVVVMTAVFPVLSRLHHEDPERLPHLLRTSFAHLFAVALPMGVGLSLVGPTVAPLLFGDDFGPAGDVLVVTGAVLVLMHLTILLGRYALAIDRQHVWIRIMVLATIAAVAADLVLIPLTDQMFDNGAIGAAFAYVVTESLVLALGIRLVAPDLFDRALVVRVAKVTLAGGAMGAAVWPLRNLALPVPILTGVVVYLTAMLALRYLDDDDRATARNGMARLLPGLAPAQAGAGPTDEGLKR